MGSFYRQQLEEWLAKLPVKADTVLDIGGAQGNIKGRTWSWDVNNYEVLDLPEFDLNFAWDSSKGVYDKADIIFCLEVFEYLINPVEAMQNITNCLKPGGKAYITFAFVYPHHNELEFDSLRYTESGIRRLAEMFDLKINNLWYRVDESGLLKQFYATDGMRAAKEYNHHDATGFIVEFEK